jgi:site-specific DNA-methyltransferase (adenine-specific)
MIPTYEIENFQFFRADNMEIMKLYPDKYFQLALVDPPYGINAPNMAATPCQRKSGIQRLNGGGEKLKGRILNTSKIKWDDIIPDNNYFNELFRISENQIIWGGNYFPLPPTRCILCWDKVQPWENFSQIELAWTSFDSPMQIFKFDNRTGDKIHPTQKPIALYEWILSKYSKPNDKIIDTHLGSNSIGIAIYKANQLDKKNLSFVGIELDEDYFNAGIERFKNHRLQLNLF